MLKSCFFHGVRQVTLQRMFQPGLRDIVKIGRRSIVLRYNRQVICVRFKILHGAGRMHKDLCGLIFLFTRVR